MRNRYLLTIQKYINEPGLLYFFLVECYATLHPALSVRPSVRQSVTLYIFWVFAVFCLTAPAQMIKWPQIQPLLTRTRLG